jgi:peroxisomal membrane protein 4
VNGALPITPQSPSTSSSSLPLAPPGHPEYTYHSFVAGAIGGYYIWGRQSAVNQQIVMYLASRVLVGLWNRAGRKRPDMQSATHQLQPNETKILSYPIVAAVVWGAVMALWEESPDVLQSSLQKSMNDIYRHDSFQSSRRKEAGATTAVTRRI